MKIATIFTEKGGMGKTTLTTLFASWLAYSEGRDVTVLDFDAPSFQLSSLRAEEKKLIASGSRTLSALASPKPYPVVRMEQGRRPEDVIAALRKLGGSGDEGYVLLDFGGNYRTTDISYRIIQSGAVDEIIIPMDSDRQSRDAALYLIVSTRTGELKRRKKQGLAVLWNRETSTERSSGGRRYAAVEKELGMMDVPVISGRVHDIAIARRDADTFGFIRSTVCWPEANVRMRCPWLEDIFREMKRLIDES